MFVFHAVSFLLTMVGLAVVALSNQLIDLFSFRSGYERLDQVPFFALLFFIYWKFFSYIFYVRMAISKKDGKSPYYEYTPTKRDIIVVWVIILSIFSSPLIYLGVITLFF